MKKLILASASPRRQALLRQMGINFEVMVEDCDEAIGDSLSPEEIVKTLALRKAENFCEKRQPNAVVLTADTIVWHNGRGMGKPSGEGEAFSMLKGLSGSEHCVYTGVCLTDRTGEKESIVCFADCARVIMRSFSDEEALAYIRSGEPFGKAGAYAIQEKGAYFVEGISGDYNTIVGLPLMRVCRCLRNMGFEIL